MKSCRVKKAAGSESPFAARARHEQALHYDVVNALLAYDEHTGIITWRARSETCITDRRLNGRYAGKEAGTTKDNAYIEIGINGRQYKAHRVAWLLKTGSWPEHGVDHRNGCGVDNSWKNLRAATQMQNTRNRKMSTTNTSKRTGVYYVKPIRKWSARITVNYRDIYLGVFACYEDAVTARKNAEIRYYGEFAASASRENAA